MSRQTFKGILDDEAGAVFTGHIYVAEGAMKTEAYQSNKNILLTDTASIMSKPFLEIYNDDVKCSHGSTTGQIDRDAMFYLQQRGICEKNARLLMMYAFADEVVRKIKVEQLQQRTEDMVHRRLKGELSSCDQCILHCNPEHIAPYQIDERLL
jgi:Fe-S cluster assembly protein SufD